MRSLVGNHAFHLWRVLRLYLVCSSRRFADDRGVRFLHAGQRVRSSAPSLPVNTRPALSRVLRGSWFHRSVVTGATEMACLETGMRFLRP